jgi:hypothetical protein
MPANLTRIGTAVEMYSLRARKMSIAFHKTINGKERDHMKVIALAAIAFAVTLSGCAEHKDGPQDKALIANQTPLGGGTRAPATSFDYKRVQYLTDGTCSAGNVYFRYLSVEDVNLGKDAIGNDIMAEADVLIHANNRYEVEYKEKYITDYTTNGYRYKRQRVRNFEGTVKVMNGKLLLDDLMEIKAQEVEGKVVATVLYKKNIVTQGLKNVAVKAVNVWSTAGIRNHREVCPDEENTLGIFSNFRARETRTSIALKGLSTNERVMAGQVTLNGLELILHADGNYHLLARVRLPGDNYGSERPYIIESGVWDRAGSMLKLYYGIVRMAQYGSGVELRFTRDLTLFDDENQKSYQLALTGKTVKLISGPSEFNMDDLMDTYR